jgi:hypothetical protein
MHSVLFWGRMPFYCFSFSFLLGISAIGISAETYQRKHADNADTLKKTQPVDSAKIRYWKLEGNLVLNFAQTFLENWASGGDNSVAGNTVDMFNANHKKNKVEWENTLKFAGGLMKLQGGNVVKTDDRIEIISKFGLRNSKHWNYSSQVSFLTQFFPGYKNPSDTIKRSDFLSPAYVNILLGMDYKPIKQLTVLMSPVSAKITILDSYFISHYNQAGVYGVPYGKHTRYEMGGTIEFQAKGDLNKLNYYSNLKTFSNYVTEPENIDLSWELIVGFKLNKFLSANLKTNLVYDDDALEKIQFKEFLGLGFSYKI